MEKDAESMATVNMKPEYAPSEIYSTSEPPPAYQRPKSTAVQVAKIIGVTVVLMSVVLGSFILASAYVTATASCRQLEQELALLTEAAERFQQQASSNTASVLQPEALVRIAPHNQPKETEEPIKKEDIKPTKNIEVITNNGIERDSDDEDDSSDESGEMVNQIQFRLPLELDLAHLAGALFNNNNEKPKMNCVVHNKRSEQLIDDQGKPIDPANISANPKFGKIIGERVAIICGDSDRINQAPEESDNEQLNPMFMQPMMFPIPRSNSPSHMAMQMMPRQEDPQMQMNQLPLQQNNQPMPHFPPLASILSELKQQEMKQNEPEQRSPDVEVMPRNEIRRPMIMRISGGLGQDFPPMNLINSIVRHIINDESREEPSEDRKPQPEEPRRIPFPFGGNMPQIPIPEEILSELNRLPMQMPGKNMIAMAVPVESESDESNSSEQDAPTTTEVPTTTPEIAVVQQQRQNAYGVTGKQEYVSVENKQPEVEIETNDRAHYVQPRSVMPSADSVLNRNKRCACNCAC